MPTLKSLIWLAVIIATLGLPGTVSANSDREAQQAELDAACEAAREEKLVPMRQALVHECVDNQEFETVSECETFYSDYGSRSGGRRSGRAPLFYDLPECVEAFNYQNSERSGG
ncbi:MAG TPA: hypothetical protein VJ984_04455 [Xanthomonadales bacterium]|nr:hypothetical protein [Xanthomonadales bacterium]